MLHLFITRHLQCTTARPMSLTDRHHPYIGVITTACATIIGTAAVVIEDPRAPWSAANSRIAVHPQTGPTFVIGAGVLSIIRDMIEGEMEVMRLGPGDYFGEIGMLTGAPTTGKFTSLTPVTVYELAKGDLAPIFEARPQVSQELCRALARRQAAGRSDATDEIAQTVPTHRLTSWFSDRLHRLYDIANAQ
jgi:CRP-like cAMP-binding protein